MNKSESKICSKCDKEALIIVIYNDGEIRYCEDHAMDDELEALMGDVESIEIEEK